MSRRRGPLAVDSDLLEHPATLAWTRLAPDHLPPSEIYIITPRRRESPVFRLTCAISGGNSVIAKRCKIDTAVTEQTLYRDVLPLLPFPSLHFFGFLEDPDPQFGWLFLEDAGDKRCDLDTLEQRALVSSWLALFHASAARIPACAHLPDTGPDYYLRVLQWGHARIVENIDNPALNASDRCLLERIVSQLRIAECRWDEAVKFCEAIPKTIVHGDLVPKNLRIRDAGIQRNVIPLDWETVGWSVPAGDLLYWLDASSYWSVIRESWPGIHFDQFLRLWDYGRIFRALHCIEWASRSLAFAWLEKCMNHLKWATDQLAGLLPTVGWES